ncbi:Mu transposase C-terminal domain-containing protein [Pelomonas sp. P7]|uniref:Mu transposase C-terminal domain-containing protein n=1 Tax=Pelomonas caseinilytica TaxID=2906763 RepID=A0ABS8XFH7_9BURK|nr:Mu transposase C-terminal domain-containing protein [Pelomonas sp. P7]MCE4539651.1 Mu transposase C-terminal domain-containing protein [Pelomonas sp. P7]
MSRKRLTFKVIPAEHRDTSRWPKIDTSALSQEDQQRVERLMPAVQSYLDTGRLTAAAASAGICNSALLEQVGRCLTPLADGSVLGWAGLVAQLRVSPYLRSADLPAGAKASQEGAAGAFKRFLAEHPKIKDALDNAIRKGLGKGNARAAHTPAKAVWRLFKRKVEEVITDETEYPRNQINCGRRSVERYVKDMIASDARARRTAVGAATAQALGSVGSGEHSFDLVGMDQDLMGIDAHHMDFFGSIEIEGPAGPQSIAVERIWVYVVICMKTRAVHGYSVSIRTEPVAEQIELALDMASRPWAPREIKMRGVSYCEGAGFPMGCVDGLTVFAPAALRMDSAMQSFANNVLQRSRRRLGCAVSYSAIGAWYHNDTVERLFGTLERRWFHQLPTSVGTGPKDPKKTDGAAEAVRLRVSWDELLDVVEIAIANYNATSQPGLGYRSPLEVLRANYEVERQRFVPRPVMPATMLTPRLGVAIERAVVRGSCRPGRMRRPYIQVDKATYANPQLAAAFDKIGEGVIVHVHIEDMRTVEVYLENGTYLGWMTVQHKGWRQTKHSRDVRKQINRLRDAREMADTSDDFVADFLNYLADKAAVEARERPQRVSETATRLADTLRSSGAQLSDLRQRKPTEVHVPLRPVPALSHLPAPNWD